MLSADNIMGYYPLELVFQSAKMWYNSEATIFIFGLGQCENINPNLPNKHGGAYGYL